MPGDAATAAAAAAAATQPLRWCLLCVQQRRGVGLLLSSIYGSTVVGAYSSIDVKTFK